MMEIRVTSTRNTQGRPILAVLLMLAMLAVALLAVWAVSAYKTNQLILLGRPVPLDDIGLIISPPKGWIGGLTDESETGTLARFFEQDAASRQPKRQLNFYQLRMAPASPGEVIGRLFQGQFTGRVDDRAAVGPLPGRQAVLHIRVGRDLQQQIVRTAIVGPGRYLVIQLFCLGPPTPYELRLMDVIAAAVRVDGEVFVPLQELDAADRMGLTDQAGAWFAWRGGTNKLLLLPSSGAGQSTTFWGAVGLSAANIDPNADLGELIRELAQPRPARPGRESLLPTVPRPRRAGDLRNDAGDWHDQPTRRRATDADAGQSGRQRQARQTPALPAQVEELKAGQLTYWRLRQPGEEVVRLTYLFRRPPGQQAPPASQPTVTPDDRDNDVDESPVRSAEANTIMIEAWCANDDEPAATAAVQSLIQAFSQP